MASNRWPIVLVASVVLLVGIGCKRTKSAGEPVSLASGKQIYEANGCVRCHSIGAASSGPQAGAPGVGMKGPNLGKVGADPGHTVAWLTAYVRNPRAQKADSRMPSFEGRIKDNDLTALAEYLASLK